MRKVERDAERASGDAIDTARSSGLVPRRQKVGRGRKLALPDSDDDDALDFRSEGGGVSRPVCVSGGSRRDEGVEVYDEAMWG